mgnify:FL=1|tara:strand:+ start:24777 stop:26168 length:1392 start_codon:yes stop_codon:yes gene_type:complete
MNDIKFTLIIVLIFSFSLASAQIKQTRPNIVIVMADDLNSAQLSCYGGENLKTAHIDALADEGMKFNNMICSEAMCVPTRASLFTGLYPMRHGSFQNHKRVYDSVPIQSVSQYLRKEGYRVALSGKDHSTKPVSVFPFEIVEGFEPKCVSVTDEYDLTKITEYITKEDDPFCLFIMSINPHGPYTVGDPLEFKASELKLPPDWIDTPSTRDRFTKYLAEVRRLDDQVGDVVKMLKDTNKYDNTIVVFLGEQGAQFPGGKWNLWDQGQKSSMIVKWNKTVTPGSQSDAIVQYEDITPTLIDIAGGSPHKNLDGKSFLSVLRGQSDLHREYAYGIHNNVPEGPAYPMRSIRTSRYKLIRNLLPESEYYIKWFMNTKQKNSDNLWASWRDMGKISSNAELLYNRIIKRPAIEFYDIQKDPYELNNLVEDPNYKDKIIAFDISLRQWMLEQGDTGILVDKHYPKSKK